MEEFGSCYWFTGVHWQEKDTLIDCLVDIARNEGEGYFLIAENENLKLYSAKKLNYEEIKSLRVLGRAIKWARSF